MDREWRVKVEETNRFGMTTGMHQRHQEIGDRNPQHVLGAMLGDAIVAMAPGDAANVLQALITRLDVLEDESLRPFGDLASFWRMWKRGHGEVSFSEFVKIKEAE